MDKFELDANMMHVFRRANWASGGVIPDRPLQAGEIKFVPKKVTLHDGYIFTDPWAGLRDARPGAGMLDAFVQLHDSPDESILTFAKKWGVMTFCKHGLPYFHCDTNDVFRWGEDNRPRGACEPIKQGSLYAEPTVFWRRLSAVANAILNIAAELNQARLGEEDDWRVANIEYLHGAGPSTTRYSGTVDERVAYGRRRLAFLITDWISIGGIEPTLRWSEGRHQWEMVLASRYGSPFAALGLALMMAASDKDGLAICSSCHKSYIPNRRPNPHRRNYCPTCGTRAAWRDAARMRRERIRKR